MGYSGAWGKQIYEKNLKFDSGPLMCGVMSGIINSRRYSQVKVHHRYKSPVEPVAKFTAGVVDTGGKFAPVKLTTAANFPPVSLIPVVHLDLRTYPRISNKI